MGPGRGPGPPRPLVARPRLAATRATGTLVLLGARGGDGGGRPDGHAPRLGGPYRPDVRATRPRGGVDQSSARERDRRTRPGGTCAPQDDRGTSEDPRGHPRGGRTARR